MRVLSVTSEAVPLVKTGGLADVAGALPAALAGAGVEMRVLVPAYRGLAERLEGGERAVLTLPGGEAALLSGRIEGLPVILLDAPRLFDRPGGPYIGPEGADWPDNAERFARLAQVAARIGREGLAGWVPDVVHAHDWQAALAPVYRVHAEGGGAPTLLTIHNIAYQGRFAASVLPRIHLPAEAMSTERGVEFWGDAGFLKGGLALADRISTVSPTYARELTTPAFGMGLEGLLRHRSADLVGILNGIDTRAWDPAADPAIAAPFTADRPGGKARNRRALAERFRLKPRRDAPLFIVICRLTPQKGLDLLIGALPALLERGACLALLGSGDAALEARFAEAARQHPGRVGTVIGYDEALAHLMQAGADAILIPSRFEPCGLTQLYGQRYGTVPVAARTGGLSDTIVDASPAGLRSGAATGILHIPGDTAALADAIARACTLFEDGALWRRMRRNAMRLDVGWEASAAEYAALYRAMLA